MKFKHEFEGATNFRSRITFSLITAHPVRIRKIRYKASDPGVSKAESNFLKLIDKLSNGTCITINNTGTEVIFMPGSITGGKITHKCDHSRGIGYYLEHLILLSCYSKYPIEATLMGVTNNQNDPSVDLIQNCWMPSIKKFLGPASAYKFRIDISSRGLPPNGGGVVKYSFHPIMKILPIQLINTGKIFKIRGIAWSCLVDKTIPIQVIKGAKEILNEFLSDVYIISSPQTFENSGKSPGYGICLWAETKQGAIYSAEEMSEPKLQDSEEVNSKITIPFDIGVKAAHHLLNQIFKNGYVDDAAQSIFLSLMALEGCRNVSQLSIGSPTPYTVENIKLILSFLGVKFHFQYMSEVEMSHDNNFKLDENAVLSKSSTTTGAVPLLVTCFGSGLQNYNKEIL